MAYLIMAYLKEGNNTMSARVKEVYPSIQEASDGFSVVSDGIKADLNTNESLKNSSMPDKGCYTAASLTGNQKGGQITALRGVLLVGSSGESVQLLKTQVQAYMNDGEAAVIQALPKNCFVISPSMAKAIHTNHHMAYGQIKNMIDKVVNVQTNNSNSASSSKNK